MKHETEKIKSLNIEEGVYTFEGIQNLPYSPKNMIDTMKSSDILLMPYQDFREGYMVLFPEETMRFFEYVKEECENKNLNADICIAEEDYKEIELHSEVINISDILVQSWVLPIITGIISSYLFKKLEQFNRTDVSTKVNITIEKDGESKTVHYEGPIEKFEDTIKSINENLFK